MTFEEALEFKKNFGSKAVVKAGVKLKLMVTPLDFDDFTRYSTDYRNGGFKDETSRYYSSDKNFCVRGMWTDGTNILYEIIKS